MREKKKKKKGKELRLGMVEEHNQRKGYLGESREDMTGSHVKRGTRASERGN